MKEMRLFKTGLLRKVAGMSVFCAIAALATIGISSCSDDSNEYTPASKESNMQVYFPSGQLSSYNLRDYADCSFTIPVKRVETAEAATINLNVTADEAFTITSSVSFAEGEDAKIITVSWDDSKIVEAQEYVVTIEIADQATQYGDYKYSFTCSRPSAWNKLYDGHVYEICWNEDYETTLYYQETEFPNIRYCKLVDAWWQLDESNNPDHPTADYVFYWNTETNLIFVPMQSIGMASSSGDIYTSSAADFYNAYQGWGKVIPSADYFDWAPAWTAKYSFFQGYYDGNGGFYLADWMYLCDGGVPTGSGYQFGGNPDYFIANGFIRTTDYNDDDHFGESAPLYTGIVASEFFSNDGTTPYKFESGLRYTEPADSTVEETTYYLTDYFGEGNCLAFTAPVPALLANESKISDVENEQATGYYVFGNEVYVSIKKGQVSLSEEEDAYPEFSIEMKAYTKDTANNVVYDFGTLTETFTANGELKDGYTLDDINGSYLADYLGTWTVYSTDYSDGNEYYYDVTISDGGTDEEENQLVYINNLSGVGEYFDGGDVLVATYNSNYGILQLPAQQISGTYQDDSIFVYALDPDAGLIYSTAELWGGFCNDGALAFVNVYESYGYNIDGLYYRTMTSRSGLSAFYDIYGFAAGGEAPARMVKKNVASISHYTPVSCGNASWNTKFAPKAKSVKANAQKKSFTLNPVEATPKHIIEYTGSALSM